MRTLATSTYAERLFVIRSRARSMLRGLALTCTLLGLLPSAAHAQTITLGPDGTIERANAPFRLNNNKPHWISYSDCVLDAVMLFPVQVSTIDLTLEVWAGTDNCPELRASEDRRQCWLVRSMTPPDDSFRVDIPVRNVVARITESDGQPAPQPVSVCDNSNDASGEAFTYYFMLVDGGQTIFSVPWGGNGKTGFDTVGPAAPSSIGIGTGESRLSLRLNGVTEQSDRERFRAFCVPAGTYPPAPDAGVDPDAGAAGSGATDSSGDAGVNGAAPAECANGVLRPGERAPVESEWECGEANEISSTIRTSRLMNGVTYAVAVAGEDALGNTGEISGIQCGTPRVLDDFYERYTEAGGPGGGGFCSVAAPGSARVASWSAAGLFGCALLLGARRRRRS